MGAVALTERRVPRRGTAAPGSRGERRRLVEFSRASIVDRLKRLTEAKDMPLTVMVRGWIVDRLQEEERRLGWEPQDGRTEEDRP